MSMNSETITRFRLKVDKHLSEIPYFINSTDHIHYILWHQMLELNSHIMKLVVDKTLKKRQLSLIINLFGEDLESILETTPHRLHIFIFAFYTQKLEDIIQYSLTYEQYEVCYNLKAFNDFYFNNTETI